MNSLSIKQYFFSLLLSVALLIAPAAAQAVIIDFEGLQDFEPVTNQYFSKGVTFTNAVAAVAPPDGTLNEIDFPPTSGVTVVTNESTGGDFAPDPVVEMLIEFDQSVSSVSGYFVYSDLLNTGQPLTVSIFQIQFAQAIATSTLFDNLGNPNFISFSGYGPIDSLRIGGGEGSFFTLDDLAFQKVGSAVVPEPSTLLLLTLGALGVVRRKSVNKP